MTRALKHGAVLGVRAVCNAFSLNHATFYRQRKARLHPPVCNTRTKPPLAYSSQHVQLVLDTLHSEEFVDVAPQTVYSKLLDQGKYLCSPRTFYRILASQNEVRERRNQRTHGKFVKPELLATAPNQVWSWDITKLKGPVKWTYYYLYLILDIYSRYIVGWMIADRESSALAKILIKQSCENQKINRNQLTLHSDRGSSMKSKPVALLLSDLGVTKSHSRPYTSNDNPYSEAHFKTAKYRPEFPNRFGCIQDSQKHFREFVQWYNVVHHHSGVAMLSPESVHYRFADEILEKRQRTLEAAFLENPSRFKGKMPAPTKLPKAVWINKPKEKDEILEKVLAKSD